MPYTLVSFHAHPDDESLLTAGVMAKAAAEGHRVVLVVATAGEVGDAAPAYGSGPTGETGGTRTGDVGDIGATRRRELERSARILGVHRVEFLDYADSGSAPGGPAPARSFSAVDVEPAAQRLAAILVDERADVLTVYDAHGGYGHPDHVQVHRVGHRAAELAGTPVVLEATINRDLMTAGIELAKSLGYEIPDIFDPDHLEDWYMPADTLTHTVDVSAFIDQKRASMAAHESQATSATEGPRTIAVFLSLPDDYFTLAFGTEWFIEKGRPPGTAASASDIFATLDEQAPA
jgi:LmbE family N-acetylglucosaminyl deacetylase